MCDHLLFFITVMLEPKEPTKRRASEPELMRVATFTKAAADCKNNLMLDWDHTFVDFNRVIEESGSAVYSQLPLDTTNSLITHLTLIKYHVGTVCFQPVIQFHVRQDAPSTVIMWPRTTQHVLRLRHCTRSIHQTKQRKCYHIRIYCIYYPVIHGASYLPHTCLILASYLPHTLVV
jgi:hypothetical protein